MRAVDRLRDGPAFTVDDQGRLEAFAASAAVAVAAAEKRAEVSYEQGRAFERHMSVSHHARGAHQRDTPRRGLEREHRDQRGREHVADNGPRRRPRLRPRSEGDRVRSDRHCASAPRCWRERSRSSPRSATGRSSGRLSQHSAAAGNGSPDGRAIWRSRHSISTSRPWRTVLHAKAGSSHWAKLVVGETAMPERIRTRLKPPYRPWFSATRRGVATDTPDKESRHSCLPATE
jgi:hypothetical protein